MLFTRRAVSSNDSCEIDDLELTVFALSAQDIKSSVVQLRLRDPSDNNFACRFVANRTETRQ